MAAPDTRLTYGSFTEKHGYPPRVEDIQDGYVMCACGRTLTEQEFEHYIYACERCEKRTVHELRPDVPRVLGTSEDPLRKGGEAGGSSAPPSMADRPERMAKVIEIPAGEYDARRTLRHCLAMAEKGEIDDVVLVCTKRGKLSTPREPSDGDDIWMTWSDMQRWSVWWHIGWAHAFIYRRYFHNAGPEEYTDEAG